ncbi:MAG TPA: MarR family transcriptional regulator [Acidimicrobiales bacterium]|nr:MarR family transcriptional regulator [Acidimicrobiales bacterium]
MQQAALDDLATQLNSVSIHLVRRARTADRALGVPPGQLSALSVLVFGGDRTIAELAETEQVTSPTMTRIVDGLERAGLAERRPHPTDARAVSVRASRSGRRLMERGRRRRVEVLLELLVGLGDEDLAAVQRAVTALSQALAKT